MCEILCCGSMTKISWTGISCEKKTSVAKSQEGEMCCNRIKRQG